MPKRKVPLTKSGKPDKRYAKSTGSKSKATGKSPSKRLKARRTEPQKPGYSANPITYYVVKIATHNDEVGYLVSYSKSARYDTDINKALKLNKTAADTVAYMLKAMRPIGIKWVEVVKK